MNTTTPSNNGLITRCPKCSTAFNVTAEVLAIAKGTVRCGSCLGVFNARQYDINKPDSSEAPSTKAPNQTDNQQATDQQAPVKTKKVTPKSVKPKTTPERPSADIDTAPEPASETKNNNAEPDNTLEQDIDTQTETQTPKLGKEVIYIDDPIDLHHEEQKAPPRWPWAVGASTMLVILLGQIAWLRFDTLSLNKTYRPYYVQACQLIHCQVPRLSDISQIRTTHFVVRSHPSEQNALIADAIIVNQSTFKQTFPALYLEFRNIHGQAVAGRHFQPVEYLKGELIGKRLMPPQQPIQLSLAIIDPGESAVNYHIDITNAKKKN